MSEKIIVPSWHNHGQFADSATFEFPDGSAYSTLGDRQRGNYPPHFIEIYQDSSGEMVEPPYSTPGSAYLLSAAEVRQLEPGAENLDIIYGHKVIFPNIFRAFSEKSL